MAVSYLLLVASVAVPSVLAASSTITPTTATTTSSMTITAAASSSSDTSGAYSIDQLPAYKALTASCLQNCLLPIGLDEPTNCDDQTNNCACLSAPIEAQQAITDCISTVCTASVSDYASTATSLYLSYCSAHYPASELASASSADLSAMSAAAASSSEAMSSSSQVTGSMSTMSTSGTSSTGSSSASAASKTSGAGARAGRSDGMLGAVLGGAALAAMAAL